MADLARHAALLAVLVCAALLCGGAGEQVVGGAVAARQPSRVFNETKAREYLLLTWASFCHEKELEAWTCEWCLDPTMRGVVTVYDRLTEAYGFLGYSKANRTIVLAFRGSSNLPNWIADFDLIKVKFAGHDAKVHGGFYGCWRGLRDQIYNHTAAILAGPCPECTNFVITGHSLGAAISGLAALELGLRYNGSGFTTTMINFGMPRVGDPAFAQLFVAHVGFSQRLVHNDDIVPHYPFQDMGYRHVPVEVWQIKNNSRTEYIVCDGSGEDTHCSDSVPVWRWSPADHDTYMNIHNDGCSKTQYY